MTEPNIIIERLRQCMTVEDIDALAVKHAPDIRRMERDPKFRVRVIHIKNLSKLKRRECSDH